MLSSSLAIHKDSGGNFKTYAFNLDNFNKWSERIISAVSNDNFVPTDNTTNYSDIQNECTPVKNAKSLQNNLLKVLSYFPYEAMFFVHRYFNKNRPSELFNKNRDTE